MVKFSEPAGRTFYLWVALFPMLLGAQLSAAETTLLLPGEKARLVELIESGGAAQSAFAAIKSEADAALNVAPNPIRLIQTEGKLAGDPVKVATQTSLKDMRALHALGYAYAVTSAPRYADRARLFILAWAKTNQPTGDPIDETNLEPLIVAYDLTRATFPADAQKMTDDYLRAVIAAEWKARQVTNNWQSHRLKIIGLAAYVLRDEAQIARAIDGARALIDVNLNADGTSFDFIHRDALHYHVYDLEPLLTLAIATAKHGVKLYDYAGANGGSLRQAVRFLIPFCTGEKQHPEFVNSKVEFDRKRAANGEKGYQIGHLFAPAEGLQALCLAAYFDDTTEPAIKKLARQNMNATASWTLLLNAASRAK